MSYLNGKDALPPALLREIQRYVQGTCLYIPQAGRKNRRKNRLSERNREICRKYAAGTPVRELAQEYYLSPQAIYKILSGGRQ